ncbi:hypothetical protein HD554DRAFT_2020281, partial [Boletus coccyginus]
SDFYTLLQIPPDASPNDIKHRTLLRLHPDKQSRPRHHGVVVVNATADPSLEEGLVDVALRRKEHARSSGPRPAQVVSLEEFTTMETEWWHRCRCGGTYLIMHGDLENGTHLVGCENCSEVIWVGYEEAPVTEDEEEQ